MEQIQLGKQDICFCGAGEAEDWGFSVMFDAMGALSTKYNDSPETASRAFDKTRDGFVIAGGGGIVCLEELEHAKARGAKIYCELVGYGANSDGYDMVAPSGEGGQRCMKMAMEMADKLGGEKQVDYVNTHGTSTPVGDTMELGGIKKVHRGGLPALRGIDEVPLGPRSRRGECARGHLLHAHDEERLPRRVRQHQRPGGRGRGHEHPDQAPRGRGQPGDVQLLRLRWHERVLGLRQVHRVSAPSERRLAAAG